MVFIGEDPDEEEGGAVVPLEETEAPPPELLQPAAKPYDARRHLGETRRVLALWLLALLFAVLIAPWVAFFLHYPPETVKDMAVTISGPVSTLLATVVGFYFGQESAR